MNTPDLHLQTFCATGVGSGLATRLTLTRVVQGRLVKSFTWDGTTYNLILYFRTGILIGCVLNYIFCKWIFIRMSRTLGGGELYLGSGVVLFTSKNGSANYHLAIILFPKQGTPKIGLFL